MADFCQQCSIELFGQDTRDLAGLITAEEVAKGFVAGPIICEGCAGGQVDHEGRCQGNCLNPVHGRSS